MAKVNVNAGDLFDHYAQDYEQALGSAISASGESREYFAQGRVTWLLRCLREVDEKPQALLDFGCGDGATTPLLAGALQASAAVGVDVSDKSLAIAYARHATDKVMFEPLLSFRPSGCMDLAYCNGVFHHIPPGERAEALNLVHRSLRTGGLFSLWENNPWNPATRYVMSQCPFDRDAQTLTPPETRSLLRAAGFEVLRTDYCFVFPRSLRLLRKLEDFVYRLPLGTQYQVLSRKIHRFPATRTPGAA
jgi:SAM-dependent methyltransferase